MECRRPIAWRQISIHSGLFFADFVLTVAASKYGKSDTIQLLFRRFQPLHKACRIIRSLTFVRGCDEDDRALLGHVIYNGVHFFDLRLESMSYSVRSKPLRKCLTCPRVRPIHDKHVCSSDLGRTWGGSRLFRLLFRICCLIVAMDLLIKISRTALAKAHPDK